MRLAWYPVILIITCICSELHGGNVFEPGITKLRKRVAPDVSPTNGWSPNLRLLVGIETVDGSKNSVQFVEVTTSTPPVTNADGKAWSPLLETNGFSWDSTNQPPVTRKIQFVWALYPVEVRVFDKTGRITKEGKTTIPFGLLTNGLAQVCRFAVDKRAPTDTEDNVRAFASGFLWMATMMGRLQSVPALKDVWDEASCCFRWPSFWTMTRAALGGGMMIQIEPDYKKISLVTTNGTAAQHFSMPMDLICNGRVLTRVETVVGPATGAWALLGGVELIQARHPIKSADHKFTARVLAVGLVRQE